MGGRVSRNNSASSGGSPRSATRKDAGKDPPPGQCWGCWTQRRDPWEHATWCPRWDESA